MQTVRYSNRRINFGAFGSELARLKLELRRLGPLACEIHPAPGFPIVGHGGGMIAHLLVEETESGHLIAFASLPEGELGEKIKALIERHLQD